MKVILGYKHKAPEIAESVERVTIETPEGSMIEITLAEHVDELVVRAGHLGAIVVKPQAQNLVRLVTVE